MFYYALLLLFIAFRLANIIQWSWWVVMIPAYVILFIYAFAKDKKDRQIAELRELLAKIKEIRK